MKFYVYTKSTSRRWAVLDGPHDTLKGAEDTLYASGFRGTFKVFQLYVPTLILEFLYEGTMTDDTIVKHILTNIGGHT